MMLIFVSPILTAVFLARIVMPFSRSRSVESMTRSATSWFARNDPACQSIASTSVVLPWSTWATIATLRRSSRTAIRQLKLAAELADDLGPRARFGQMVRLAGPEVDHARVTGLARRSADRRRRVVDLRVCARRVRVVVHEAIADAAREAAGEGPREGRRGVGGDDFAVRRACAGFGREHERG